MVLTSFLIGLIVAIIMTAIFVWGFGTRKSWSDGLAFFVLVWLASWAGGIWVRPLNMATPPPVPWFSALVVGLFTSLLLSWSVPAWGRPQQAAAVATERRAPPVSIITPAYWVALAVLVIAIIVH